MIKLFSTYLARASTATLSINEKFPKKISNGWNTEARVEDKKKKKGKRNGTKIRKDGVERVFPFVHVARHRRRAPPHTSQSTRVADFARARPPRHWTTVLALENAQVARLQCKQGGLVAIHIVLRFLFIPLISHLFKKSSTIYIFDVAV